MPYGHVMFCVVVCYSSREVFEASMTMTNFVWCFLKSAQLTLLLMVLCHCLLGWRHVAGISFFHSTACLNFFKEYLGFVSNLLKKITADNFLYFYLVSCPFGCDE